MNSTLYVLGGIILLLVITFIYKSVDFKTDAPEGIQFHDGNWNGAMDLAGSGEGLALAKKYNIRGYPTLLFINKDGEIMSRATGYLNSTELLQFANTVN